MIECGSFNLSEYWGLCADGAWYASASESSAYDQFGCFGVVLLKLVIVDLWLLPTVGKIIVFIMLGVILLVLSFLYQKLKKVLFMDNKEEVG